MVQPRVGGQTVEKHKVVSLFAGIGGLDLGCSQWGPNDLLL